MTNPELNAPDDGPIDYAAIEREAYRLRAEAMRTGALAMTGWLKARLHRRPVVKARA
ncbi:RSP_7527 family protein [Frigidibacter sp. ROC022]|uniref:RSP_7527 family protein n=1 Tax=Frigidibacter sp. ROC022 TaxID=2971796 RepID=UPI00215B4AD6|nr:hypothetical protein [Frigidibacter sp. ROC022]MCR8723423.1 hypothetical protein [Frigidibacter sp. ROC022]